VIWTEERLPPTLQAMYEKMRWPREEWPRRYVSGQLLALVGRETWLGDPPDERRWHISLSHKERIPNWEELVETAHDLRPGVPFCMGVPPRSWWMNVHPNVLHMWEPRDPALIIQWRMNATGQAPS
jgi:hypothetical protein